MHPFKRYQEARERSTSQIEFATIVAALPGGGWTVKVSRTGRTVRASGPAGFVPGQAVQISRTDASGVTKNTGYIILGAGAQTMHGQSASQPLAETRTTSGLSVISVVPNPVAIAAGATVVVDVYGVGLDGAAITYSAGLTDGAAPVVTPTHIILTIHADVAMSPGDYTLKIGEQPFPVRVHA